MSNDNDPSRPSGHATPDSSSLASMLAEGCRRISRQALVFLSDDEPEAKPADLTARLDRLAETCATAIGDIAGTSRVLLILENELDFMPFGDPAGPLMTLAKQVVSSQAAIVGAKAEQAGLPLRLNGRIAGAMAIAGQEACFGSAVMSALAELGDAFGDAWQALRQQHQRQVCLNLMSARQDQLVQNENNRTLFLGVLSHELRNPATALIMGLSLLDIVAPDSAQAVRAREIMRNQTRQLVHLLDELQDVTRLERHSFALNRENVDLTHVAQGTVFEMQDLYAGLNVQLQVLLPDKPVRLQGDAARLADMFRQLLDNALKASGPGDSVRFQMEADKDGQSVTVDVQDQGRGIAAEDLPLLFQTFALADRRFDRMRNGLGIGLAIVRGIAELHGGQVAAFSEGVGKGACFVIRLPLTPEGPIRSD